MGLAISLHLRDLVDGLPPHARFGVGAIKRPAVQGLQLEHQAVAPIAVMGNRKDSSIGLGFIAGHVLPEVLGVRAVVERKRNHLVHPIGAIPKDHHSVEISAQWGRAPFEAPEGREAARLVEALGGRSVTLPC